MPRSSQNGWEGASQADRVRADGGHGRGVVAVLINIAVLIALLVVLGLLFGETHTRHGSASVHLTGVSALIWFALTKQFALAMVFATLTGFGSIAQYAISNIIVQSESAPEMRGRAIGVLLMAIFGTVPLGSLLVGAVSQHIGAPVTVLCEGIAGVLITLGFTKFLLRSKDQ